MPADKNGDYSQNRARPEPWWCHLVRFGAQKSTYLFLFLFSQVGLLPLDPAVRREDAGDRSWGPQAPHQDTRQPVRHREGQQARVLPLGAKCSCVLQTGDD